MINSMTGFGAGKAERDGIRCRVEVRSVNSRTYDIQVRCGQTQQDLVSTIKEHLQGSVSRGKVTATVEFEEEGAGAGLPIVDEAIARAYLRGMEKLSETVGLSAELALSDLVRLPGLFRFQATELDDTARLQLAIEALEPALVDFLAMRAQEGKVLMLDLGARLTRLQDILSDIKGRADQWHGQLETRLQEKLERLLEPGTIDETRLAMEVAILAERADVTEEIVRLSSHTEQFLQTLENGGEVGRRLNFLLQEMNREANTIGSKVSETDIIYLVVEVKEEVERLREQVQNLA